MASIAAPAPQQTDEQRRIEVARTTRDRVVLDSIVSSRKPDDQIALALAYNRAATAEDMRWASKAESPIVLEAVAKHRNTDRPTLLALLVRMEVHWAEFMDTEPSANRGELHRQLSDMELVLGAQEAIWNALGTCTGTESAKAMRGLLKAWFPRTKFSIRQETALGYRDVVIRWENGPQADAVRTVIRLFVVLTRKLEWEPSIGQFDRARCYRTTT